MKCTESKNPSALNLESASWKCRGCRAQWMWREGSEERSLTRCHRLLRHLRVVGDVSVLLRHWVRNGLSFILPTLVCQVVTQGQKCFMVRSNHSTLWQLLMVCDNVPAATLHFLWGSIIWDLTRWSVRGLVLLPRANNYFGFLFTVCPLGWTWYQSPRGNIKPGATAVSLQSEQRHWSVYIF